MSDMQLPDMDVADRVFAERLPAEFIHHIGSQPPDPTCIYCDAELVDLDMAEDEDGRQYGTGRCPDPECDANLANPECVAFSVAARRPMSRKLWRPC